MEIITDKDKKIFLLGIGAQKSGTTWLYSYLNSHPDTDMGFAKEYHVFHRCKFKNGEIQKTFKQSLKHSISRFVGSKLDYEKSKFIENPASYFDYFRSIADNPSVRLTGDITPIYSGLPVDAFAYIKENIEKRDLDLKVIFLMRDPVERCISATRMKLKNQKVIRSNTTENAHLRCLFKSESYQKRTRYDITISNLDKIFKPENLFFGFYEELFNRSSVQNICKFLRIDYIEPQLDIRINESRTSNEIPEGLRAQIAEYYKPTYEFIGNRFGVSKMHAIWSNYRFLNTLS